VGRWNFQWYRPKSCFRPGPRWGSSRRSPRLLSRLERGHPSPYATPLDTDPPSALAMRPPPEVQPDLRLWYMVKAGGYVGIHLEQQCLLHNVDMHVYLFFLQRCSFQCMESVQWVAATLVPWLWTLECYEYSLRAHWLRHKIPSGVEKVPEQGLPTYPHHVGLIHILIHLPPDACIFDPEDVYFSEWRNVGLLLLLFLKYFITYLLSPCEREMLLCGQEENANGIRDREVEGKE